MVQQVLVVAGPVAVRHLQPEEQELLTLGVGVAVLVVERVHLAATAAPVS